MARPRNDQKRTEILRCAVRLFRQQGYKKTSYQSIADEANESRAVVQYYFPKKTDFVAIFFNMLGECTLEVLEKHEMLTDEKYVNFYLDSQLYYNFLVSNQGTKLFLSDILENRSLSDDVMLNDIEWLKNFFEEETEEERERSLKISLIRGGGLLTYIHYWLPRSDDAGIESIVQEIESIVRENTHERMILDGIPAHIAFSMLEPYKLSKEERAPLLKDLDDGLLLRF